MKMFNVKDKTNKDSKIDIPLTEDEKKESLNVSIMDISFGAPTPAPTPQTPTPIPTSPDIQQYPNTTDPEDFMFDMGQVTLLNNTTIYFNCFVEKDTVDSALSLIKTVNKNIAAIEMDYPEIKGNLHPKFVINSGGGNVIQGLRLFDAIKNNVYPMTTVVNGIAASMGIIILVAGAKVQATEHSVLMIHQLSAGAQGKFFELKGYMKFWTDLQDTLASILVANTKAKKEDIATFMSGETYIMAPDALKLGLIESIVNL